MRVRHRSALVAAAVLAAACSSGGTSYQEKNSGGRANVAARITAATALRNTNAVLTIAFTC